MVRREARFLSARLLLMLLGAAVSSCRSSPEPAAGPREPATSPINAARSGAPSRRYPPRFEYLGGDTYIHRMQWLRADETVETLRLLLEERSGREVIMVPHEETNAILFRVVPAGERAPRLPSPPTSIPPGGASP